MSRVQNTIKISDGDIRVISREVKRVAESDQGACCRLESLT
jgi:hypothetical protein